MVATSYPRFPGDTVGTFMEPIAHGLAARGHEVHMVLPWHPRWTRGERDGGVHFHLFRYAPHPALHLFGYAGALDADVRLRVRAVAATPLALASGWRLARRVAQDVNATVMHGHWVVPGGAIAAAAAGGRPLVVSLHGSDVFVAERHAPVRQVARWVFGRARVVTACSDDLRTRAVAIGAARDRSHTIPYGVDTGRFRPDPAARARMRSAWGVGQDAELVVAAGRFVRKKGFEYLIDAIARLAPGRPRLTLVLAGAGDLDADLRQRAAERGIADRVIFPGLLLQDEVGSALAAADVVAVPSVRDDAGNVDGLPNVVLEGLASGTPVVAFPAGGIGAVVRDGVTGLLAPERDVNALAAAIARLLDDSALAERLGREARRWAETNASWAATAAAFEQAYEAACGAEGAGAA
ncbi:MAG TPA: glycosyltransferase [Vicinamibacterales bacterium]